MNVQDTLRGLLRRWYIVAPGLLAAAAAAAFVWTQVPPTYERTAKQLLMPGEASLPAVVVEIDGEEEKTTPNPFLYLGGLSTAADVLVSAAGAAEAVQELTERHPGTEITVARDFSNSAPMLLVTVSATADDVAAEVVDAMLASNEEVLARLQDEQKVPAASQVSIWTVAVAPESTLGTRERMLATVGVGAGAALMSLLLAALIDGLARRPRRGHRGRKAGRRRRAERDAEPGTVRRSAVEDDAEDAEAHDAEPPVEASPDEVEVEVAIERMLGEAPAAGEPIGARPTRRS